MQESSLHSELKNLFAAAGGVQEVWVDGYLVDILHGDQVIEIQTRHFSALKHKIQSLLTNRAVHIVHPIAIEKWITREGITGSKRRRSPRKGRPEDLFYELVSLAHLVDHPGFSVEIVLARIEEIRVNDGKGSWRRRGWSISDRNLLEIIDRSVFCNPSDYLLFLPASLPHPFTTQQLAQASDISPGLALKMIYCLRQMGNLQVVGKQGRAWLYDLSILVN